MGKNYSKYSEKTDKNINEEIVNEEVNENEEEVVNEEINNEEVNDEEKPEEEVVNEEINNEEVNDEEKPEEENSEIKNAVVVNCTKLNVRKEASKDSKVVCIIDKDTELTVDMSKSTDDFYKVYTSSNEKLFEGYCVKEFISIK